MEKNNTKFPPIMTPLPSDLPNILLPAKCRESRVIWLLFKMSKITRSLFEKNMWEKFIIFHGRGTGKNSMIFYFFWERFPF